MPLFHCLVLVLVFVLRPDTIDFIRASMNELPIITKALDDARYLYTYSSPKLLDVLEKRTDLLHDVVSVIKEEGKKKTILEGVDSLYEILSKGRWRNTHVLRNLEQLSRQGLRHIMKHLAQYSWVSIPTKSESFELTERFVKQYSPTLLVFILGGKRRFSQTFSRFPNFYHVCCEGIETRHTYWLKRLIAEYIYTQRKNDLLVTPLDVISTFCGGGGYEEL